MYNVVAHLGERVAECELRISEFERVMLEWVEAASSNMPLSESRIRGFERKADKLAAAPVVAENGHWESRRREHSPEDAVRDKFSVQESVLELQHRMAALEQHLSVGIVEELQYRMAALEQSIRIPEKRSLSDPKPPLGTQARGNTQKVAWSSGHTASRASSSKEGRVRGSAPDSTELAIARKFFSSSGGGFMQLGDLRLEPKITTSTSLRNMPRGGAEQEQDLSIDLPGTQTSTRTQVKA